MGNLHPTETDGVMDAIREVSWAFEQLQQATTLPQQATAYDRLANAMGDLETWHPDYDVETGDIPEVPDEVQTIREVEADWCEDCSGGPTLAVPESAAPGRPPRPGRQDDHRQALRS